MAQLLVGQGHGALLQAEAPANFARSIRRQLVHAARGPPCNITQALLPRAGVIRKAPAGTAGEAQPCSPSWGGR
jgi:hypothetical protein